MKIQTKYMQTIVCNITGRLLGYRVTFPIPESFALSGVLKPGYVQRVGNKYFYINSSSDFDNLERAVKKLQIRVAQYKINELKLKIVSKQLELFYE